MQDKRKPSLASARLAWPVDPARHLTVVRQAREDLLDGGLTNIPVASTGVREVIERSWRRCIGEAVPTDARSLPFADVDELQPRLRAAAAPVLDRLADQLSDAHAAMFLSDEHGRIIMRRVSEPGQRGRLDNISAAEGFDFSEDVIGTNGLGSVVQERAPVLVHGAEHYSDVLVEMTCAGTPVFEPYTRQLLGTFALACPTAEASSLMCAMATDVGRQIEGNLTAMLGAHERVLIQSYLFATRSDRDPVIVVTERSAFANTAGLPHVTPEAHAVLWMHLHESGLRPGQHRTSVPLPTGWCDAVVEHVGGGNPAASAYCVRVLGRPSGVERPARRPSRSRPPRPLVRLHPLPGVDDRLRSVVRLRERLAVDGPAGSGKLHTAAAVLREITGSPPRVIDLTRTGVPPVLDGGDGRGVVLRHLQDASVRDVNRIKAAIEDATVPVAVTVDLTAADDPIRALVAQTCTHVQLPRLQEMAEQVPQLVNAMVRALPDDQSATRFSSEALQQLMRWSWPGNIAELRQSVEQLARRKPGRTVQIGDLPQHMTVVSPRTHGMIESAERDAILKALRRAGGNRSKAAAELGIGRTTLYRKLRAYAITP